MFDEPLQIFNLIENITFSKLNISIDFYLFSIKGVLWCLLASRPLHTDITISLFKRDRHLYVQR